MNIDDLADALAARMARRPSTGSATLREFATTYMQRHAKPHKKSWRHDETLLRLHVLPVLGAAQLTDITTNQLLELQAGIGDKVVPNKAKSGGRYQSNRCLELVGQMFRLARSWGYYPEDRRLPTEGIRAFAEPSRERFVDHSEMDRLADSIDQCRAYHLRALFWLCLLTGLRRDELRLTKWCEIDLQSGILHVPGSRTKSGRPVDQPLSAEACRLLDALPRRNAFVFTAAGEDGPVAVTTVFRAWDRIRRRAGLADIRIHDLRRTVGSWLAQSGTPLGLVGKVLNHSGTWATEIYARFANADVRQALETHSVEVSSYIRNRGAQHQTVPGGKEADVYIADVTVPLPSVPSLAKALSTRAPHLRAFFWLYLLTGLSQKDLLSARWQDLDLNGRELLIRADHSIIVQPLSEAAAQILEDLPCQSPCIFGREGKALPISKPSISNTWNSICRAAGLPGMELRGLRKTATKILLEAGVPPRLVDCIYHRKAPRFSRDKVLQALELLAAKMTDLAEHTQIERIDSNSKGEMHHGK